MSLLIRTLATGLLVACTVAVLVGRTAPPPAPPTYDPARHLALVDDPASGRRPLVLDTRTGALTALPLPARQDLRCGSLSPWVSATGEREVVGWWTAWSAGGPAVAVQADVGLARVSFATGRVLEHIPGAPVPSGAPCWDPGVPQRLLYPAFDGLLYHVDFHGEGIRGPEAPRIGAVSWARWPDSLSDPFIDSVCWPDHSVFGGRLLAAVRFKDAEGRSGPVRFWWLTLSPCGTEVVEAGPIALGDPDEESNYASPSLHVGPDGAALLAFQRSGPRGPRALLLAKVAVRDLAAGRAIAHDAVRLVADRVARPAAVFAVDGRTLFAPVELARGGWAVQRFSLGDNAR